MKPLAERMRPASLEHYQGQPHLLGEQGVLRALLAADALPSMILWGPPGVGKTTLARLLTAVLNRPLHCLNAVNAGVREVRNIINQAQHHDLVSSGAAVVFIDEIHRFSKSQQVVLLSAVEEGVIILIGATTENPSFEVISPLLSRCQVYVLEPLTEVELLAIAQHACEHDEILSQRSVQLNETGSLLRLAAGDARKMLNILEWVVTACQQDEVVVTDELVQAQEQRHLARYDKDGEQHYDLISAFIKSIRGSDPNAAVYYLARMIEGGEDPLFIARRLVVLAAEDVGNANPQGIILASSCFQAVNAVGMPEGRILLSQCATYLACSPKSNASYQAINQAMAACKEHHQLPVPLALRNAPTALMHQLGYGDGYQYAHNYERQFVALEFLPEQLSGQKFYDPGDAKWEQAARQFLRHRWQKKYDY